ncbi:uncharacterized protein LOC115717537 [Cannabis sativa]|uniref:uncharacterized protein LOC115717537 n=1 Tax=Cannabis sativa TaxID=3483 RepID=UPI0029CA7C4F|nr:uncharacterized protein LOC115717537 [Cannabis sativa]
MYQIVAKLKALKLVFKKINQEGFTESQSATIQVARTLNFCQDKLLLDPQNLVLQQEESDARIAFTQAYKNYQLFLRQKAKTSWIRDGDDNIAVFHASLKARNNQNRILSIVDAHGTRVDDPNKITEVFLGYYQQLLGTKMMNRRKVIGQVLNKGPTVSMQQSLALLAPITDEEIKNAILKDILPTIVAQNQGGFVKGRFIAHNIMICQDLVRHYGRKSSKANCLIKLDLQKAYDTIECDFIEEVQRGLLFPEKFITLVMNCVKTPKFSLFFNGSLHGFFESKRGLRQGIPLSPLLFVIGMEYLSRILKKVGDKSDFAFHDRCDALKLNHLSFADDVLLFCRGDDKSIILLLQGLKLFLASSELQPNKAKSAIYCSNMPESDITRVLEASGFSKQQTPFRYLGIPICSKRISKQECTVLTEKMTARIRSWSTRNISFVGRVVLINSVLTTIHSYWCQILKLPKKGAGLVAWENVCQSKIAGGSGIKRTAEWNSAVLFKIELHGVMRFGGDLTHQSIVLSFGWLCKIVSKLRKGCSGSVSLMIRLAAYACYKLRHMSTFSSVDPFAEYCLQQVKRWLSWGARTSSLSQLLKWIHKAKISKFKRKTMAAAVANLVYSIWHARNDQIWNSHLESEEAIVQRVKDSVKHRIKLFWPQKIGQQDRDWFHSL